MPELDVMHIAIIAATTVVGVILGWIMRGRRSQDEKAAINSGWQEQVNAQRTEHDRLTNQNKGLMEQINQYQASNQDAKNRARELSEAVQEAYARRDELQREIKDIRGNLEVAVTERDQLQAKSSSVVDIEAKDSRIRKLQLELESWQNRLPPLIEKFRARNEDAERLEAELEAAHERIAELETQVQSGQTRIEPVRHPDTLTDGRDASNDTMQEQAFEERPVVVDDEDEDEDADVAPAINGARDNLRKIKGVGPAIEKTLNELGIFSYQQIAEMSEYDIDRVAKRLKGFRSRIYREDWIGQARELRDQTPGD